MAMFKRKKFAHYYECPVCQEEKFELCFSYQIEGTNQTFDFYKCRLCNHSVSLLNNKRRKFEVLPKGSVVT